MNVLVTLCWQSSVFCVSAFVACVGWRLLRDDTTFPTVAWAFVLPGTALALAAVLLKTTTGPRALLASLARLWPTGAIAVGLGISASVGQVPTFCVAYTCTPFVFFVLQLLYDRGIVLYDPNTAHFVTTRSVTYAALRAFSCALVPHRNVTRFAPVVAATLETLGMAYHSPASSYAFETRSEAFIVYSIYKTALFLLLPVVEDALLGFL